MYMYLGYICMSLAICLKAIAMYIHRKSGTLVMLVWLCVCMCDVYACVVCVCVCVCVCMHACALPVHMSRVSNWYTLHPISYHH